jgi:molybdopterin converting factor subunit 1
MHENSMNKMLAKENMRVKILFFATLRDYAGARTVELEIPEGTTVANMKESLVKRYPKMIPAQNSIMAAINHEFAAEEQVIPLDAEVALFPPVSGG